MIEITKKKPKSSNDLSLPKDNKKPSLYWSVRFLFSIVMAVCYIVVYLFRSNMSLAIVCMVNSTALLEIENLTATSSEISYRNNHTTTAKDGKFIWSKADQGLILSAYFYGYLLTQITGGWCALKFGGIRIIVVSTLVASILSMLTTPFANLDSILAVFILRFLIGFTHGFTVSALIYVFVNWAPPEEKSSLIGFSLAGTCIGTVVSMLLGSYLCEFGFLDGWGSIFILYGAFGILVAFITIVLTTESPATHRFISDKEKTYIMESITKVVPKKTIKTPWKEIFTSKACYSIFISNIALDWGMYLFLTCTPTYMKDVLRYDLTSNAFFSSFPFVASLLTEVLGGVVADKIIEKKLLSRTNCRKLFNAIGMFVPMICAVLLAFVVDHTNAFMGVILLTLAVGIMGVNHSAGFCINIMDVAGQYAGILFGISNTIGTIPGVVAPYLVGLITPRGTREEWRTVFLITAGLFFICGLPFMFMAKSSTEKWAEEESLPAEITTDNKAIEEKQNEPESDNSKNKI